MPIPNQFSVLFLQAGVEMEIEDQSSSLSQEETPSPSTSPDHRPQTPPPDLQIERDYSVPLTSPTKWSVSTGHVNL